jgi:hypothetical protein
MLKRFNNSIIETVVLKTKKGSPIRRYKFVGKKMGDDLYFHKDYVDEYIDKDFYNENEAYNMTLDLLKDKKAKGHIIYHKSHNSHNMAYFSFENIHINRLLISFVSAILAFLLMLPILKGKSNIWSKFSARKTADLLKLFV